MKLKFRNSDSLAEIVNIVKLSTADRTVLWQNKNGKRAVYGPSQIFYDESLHTIQFQIKNYDFSILVDEIIYIKLSYNESLFKGQVLSTDQGLITIYLPEEVKTLELRQNKRTPFMPKDEKKVYVEVAKDVTSERRHRLAFTALDISTSGVSLIVSDNNKQLMESSGMHLLVALGAEELEEPIVMDYRYGQSFRYRIRGKTYMSNRFGFKFLDNINQAVLDHFVSQI